MCTNIKEQDCLLALEIGGVGNGIAGGILASSGLNGELIPVADATVPITDEILPIECV